MAASVLLACSQDGPGGITGPSPSPPPPPPAPVAPTAQLVLPQPGATGVPVSQAISVEFSRQMNPATVTASSFVVSPANGDPISGTIAFETGTLAHFTPSTPLAEGTTYVVKVSSGAKDMSGTPLSPELSASFSTVAPVIAASVPPEVMAVSPANGAAGVATNSTVIVTFSESMSAASITSQVFTLTPAGGSAIAATVAYDPNSNTATLTPSSALAFSTTYTVNVTSGAKSLTDGALVPFSSTFSTVAAPEEPPPAEPPPEVTPPEETPPQETPPAETPPQETPPAQPPADTTPPSVVAVDPANGASNVLIGSGIRITFSEPMDPSTVTTNTFVFKTGGSVVSGIIVMNTDNTVAILYPVSQLTYSTTYTVSLTSGALDLAGNGLTPFNSSFVTQPEPDVTPPAVTTVNPANGAANVTTGTAVNVTFSEPVNPATINSGTVTLIRGGSAVAANIVLSNGNRVATLTPLSALSEGATYTVSVTGAVQDLAGNGATPFSSTFTTVAPVDVTPPSIVSVTPATRAAGVSPAAQVKVAFSEPIDFSTVNANTFVVTEFLPTGQPIPGTRTYDANTHTLIFTPSVPYVDNKSIIVNITTGVKDLAGNSVSSLFTSCFTPQGGAGTAISMTGFWAANTACLEVHWHLQIVEDASGNLSLGSCSEPFCTSYSTSAIGTQRLGGDSCPPTNVNPGVVFCELKVVSLTGTHVGNNVSMSWKMENGLTFGFTGTYAADSNTGNKFLNGVTFGATLPSIGTTFEREGN